MRPRWAGPGPKTAKKYLQVACTSLLTYYFLGGRDLASFKAFVYSDLHCLCHRQADVLRFLSDTAIPPTSNQAERDLRSSKTQQKISGRLRSEKTTRRRYAIRGSASTAAEHGIAVRDALAGNPWIPPIPASPDPHSKP